ncbi:MAG: glycosyltransferase, partial [Proteobacteria bacterium]|nr:glycosyltransferase [Pseudomonadota bacterium]
MNLSAIICTYNRAAILTRCLSHLAGQKVPAGLEWEIIVVDNNSSDGTDKVVEQLARLHPILIRYVKEPQQGLNYARNRG